MTKNVVAMAGLASRYITSGVARGRGPLSKVNVRSRTVSRVHGQAPSNGPAASRRQIAFRRASRHQVSGGPKPIPRIPDSHKTYYGIYVDISVKIGISMPPARILARV